MRPQFGRICTNINVKNRKISKKTSAIKQIMDSESTNLYLKNVLQRDHLKCQVVFHTETTIHEKAVSQEGEVK